MHFKTGWTQRLTDAPRAAHRAGLLCCSLHVKAKDSNSCVTREKITTIPRGNTPSVHMPCHAPACAKDCKYKGRSNFCLSSIVWKALCGKPNQTQSHYPHALVSASPGGFQWWRVRKQLQGTRQQGNSGPKALVCELQHSDGPAALLAQPSVKEMLGFMLAQKNPKNPLSIPKGHQKPSGALLKGFPSLSELFNLTWCGWHILLCLF